MGHWALAQAVVSFEISVLLYNEGPGGMRDYLSAGEAMLPTVYMVRSPPSPPSPALYQPGLRQTCTHTRTLSLSL